IYSFNKKAQKLKRNFKCQFAKDSTDSDIDILAMDVTKDTIWFTVSGKGVGCYQIKKGIYTLYPCTNKLITTKSTLDIKYFQKKSTDEYYIGLSDYAPGIFNKRTHQ